MATQQTESPAEIVAPPPGTIVLFSGRGLVSRMIEIGTCSPYSHVAHICRIAPCDLAKEREVRTWRLAPAQIAGWQDGNYLVESTTLGGAPCVIQGKPFSGVQVHRFADYVRGYKGKVWLMRPVKPLTSEESQRLTDVSLDVVATPYDTAGAGLAWTRVLKRLCFWRTADRETMFCVETLLACLLFALQGRILPRVDPGEATPSDLSKVMCGLFRKPELQEAR